MEVVVKVIDRVINRVVNKVIIKIKVKIIIKGITKVIDKIATKVIIKIIIKIVINVMTLRGDTLGWCWQWARYVGMQDNDTSNWWSISPNRLTPFVFWDLLRNKNYLSRDSGPLSIILTP